MTTYRELTSLNALEEMLRASYQQPVLFFKHSSTCGISTRAFSEFEKYLATAASTHLQHAVIVVQRARAVSDKLEELTGVLHESPQAILVRDGKPLWHESHLALQSDRLGNVANSVQ